MHMLGSGPHAPAPAPPDLPPAEPPDCAVRPTSTTAELWCNSQKISKDLTLCPTPSSSRGVRCTRCGRDNSVGLRFCQDCGCRLDPAQDSPEPQVPRLSAAPTLGRPEAPSLGFASKQQLVTHCPNCGVPAAAGNSYCPECGASLAPEISPIVAAARRSLPPTKIAGTDLAIVDAKTTLCTQCNCHNRPSDVYCHACGAALPSTKSTHQPSEPTRAIGVSSGHPLPGAEPLSTQRPAQLAAQQQLNSTAGPCLLVVAQDGTTGRCYPINQPQMDIGRLEGDILLPDDRFICPRHARLLREGAKTTIQDLASVNGVFKRIRNPAKLEHGDVFLLGLGVFRFELLAPGEQHLSSAVERGTQVFGTPPSPRYARISELTMEGVSRSIFVVTREETILGREVGDIVFSSDPFMSRRHAAISRNSPDGSFTLLDLGSSNGTFLRIRGLTELVAGDHVRVGQHLFRFDQNNGQVSGLGQAQAR